MTAAPDIDWGDTDAHRRGWASAHIRDAKSRGPIPRYGDHAWHQLTATDPRRWAAIIIAAECWASDGDDIPGRLRRDLAHQADIDEQLLDEDFAAMAANVRALAGTPSHAELQTRRQEPTR